MLLSFFFFIFICSKAKDCLQVCFLVNHRLFTHIAWYISNTLARRSPGEWVTALLLKCLHRNLRCNWTILIRWWSLFFVKVLLSHSLSSSRLWLVITSIRKHSKQTSFSEQDETLRSSFAVRLVPLLFSTCYGSIWRRFESWSLTSYFALIILSLAHSITHPLFCYEVFV